MAQTTIFKPGLKARSASTLSIPRASVRQAHHPERSRRTDQGVEGLTSFRLLLQFPPNRVNLIEIQI